MEVNEALCQQDRLQLLSEKRKWQTEIENKKRQLEDDRRALQHLKSKALRERWLLDGAPTAGPEQDEVKRQLEQDEAKTRTLEETINRLEQELVSLETGGVCETVSSGAVEAVQVKGHNSHQQERPAASPQIVHVVHEMNGEDGVQLLSLDEVEELIHKADEASMMSQTVAMVTSLPTAEVQEEEAGPKQPLVAAGITGLEAKMSGEVDMEEASAEKPVTMVFMGYQSVEDEDETRKVLGLQGTVKAELVLIDDGKTSPGEAKEEPVAPPPPVSIVPPPSTKPAEATVAASNGETAVEAEEVKGGAVEMKKEKYPCKCCSVM
ncbi:paralemmin 1a isoform X7 [Acanthopagrus latus]|uniref:paralemmin 1a isoform X7 n=1 Tax=Acanthopagrus latus TaxID=8177 RepID=UPI00187C52AC|nr:paralemmin 1a isoform X7 [Acanthopagrus latus]